MKLENPSIFPVFFQQFEQKGGNWQYFYIAYQLNDMLHSVSIEN